MALFTRSSSAPRVSIIRFADFFFWMCFWVKGGWGAVVYWACRRWLQAREHIMMMMPMMMMMMIICNVYSSIINMHIIYATGALLHGAAGAGTPRHANKYIVYI